MQIERIIWPRERIEHIARHGVTPTEVEEVCFGRSLVLRAKSQGENPVYYILGETEAGRQLFCVMIRFPDARGFPVTARDMTAKEKNDIENGKSDEKAQATKNRFDSEISRVLGLSRRERF